MREGKYPVIYHFLAAVERKRILKRTLCKVKGVRVADSDWQPWERLGHCCEGGNKESKVRLPVAEKKLWVGIEMCNGDFY